MTQPLIPYNRHTINADDIAAVLAVLQSDWLTQGDMVPAFERALAAYCGVSDAIAVANGTAALHLACLAFGLQSGERVWTTPISFVASANCARYCGGVIDFVDIEPTTQTLAVAALEQKLAIAQRTHTLPKLLIPVHFAGRSCDMQSIAACARHYDIRIIEDAAHALGGVYQSQPIGHCTYSDCAIMSFHPVKSITTGEGGAIVTNNAQLAHQLRLLRSHGITRDVTQFVSPSTDGWYYEQQQLGFNYRLTDIQAALGCSQLTRLDAFIEKRRALAARYDALLADVPLVRPPLNSESAWHLYVIQLRDAAQRRTVYDRLRAQGIGVNVHYIPIHLQPDYRRLGFQDGDFPVAEQYYQRALTLPLFVQLTPAQQFTIVEHLKQALIAA